MNYCWVLLSCLLMTTTCNANTNDLINEASQKAAHERESISHETITAMEQAAQQSYAHNQTLIEQVIQASNQKMPSAHKGQYIDGAVLFVSFSMPEQLLFSLAEEAAFYKIPVVINGLIDGDFKKTITTFSKLQKQAKKEKRAFNGVSIDPLWFEQFQISAVPAFVVSKRPSSCGQQFLCKEQPYDVVYGNASIKDSLNLIASKGETASDVAKSILENGHV